MFKPEDAWEIIKQNAEKAMKTQIVFRSLKKRKPYIVKAVKDNSITIQRKKLKTTTKLRLKDLSADTFKKLLKEGIIKRKNLLKPVAKETAFVLFHPQLTWSSDTELILLSD